MTDINPINNQSSFSPEEIAQYKKDYQEGFSLFKEAFFTYDQPHLPNAKKAQLKKVMDESLQVMNQVAYVALQKKQHPDEKNLEKNYHAFIKEPNEQNRKNLLQSIQALT